MERVLGQARFAQALTIAWMVIEGAVAIGAGIAARSLALTAFGLDSMVELVSSAVVLRQLLDPAVRSDRRAARFVGWALAALVVYIAVGALASFAGGVRAEPSAAGLAITAAAVVVMSVLWRWRLALADRLGSAALRADAGCSQVCLWLSVITLAGVALDRLFGWWWADPLAALALTWWIAREAREALSA